MDSPLRLWRARLCHRPVILFASLTLLIASGCRRSEPLEWDPNPQVSELPTHLQEQVGDVIEFHAGSATDLKLLTWKPTLKVGDITVQQQQKDIERQKFLFEQHLKHGQAVYTKRCEQCHGVNGDGNGPTADYLYPRPRDYTKGIFKFTSTPYGSKPRREDLVRTLRKGITGTSMPAFNLLPEEDIEAVVDYVLLISQRGELEEQIVYLASDLDEEENLVREAYFLPPEEKEAAEDNDDHYEYDVDDTVEVIKSRWDGAEESITQPLTPQPQLTEDRVARGRQAFLTKGCSKCHGEDGRGHTPANIGKDTWGNATRAADLTSGMLHGGQRPIDIYRRILNGINGTPMPGFSSALKSEPETIWDLVSYVLEISGRRRDILLERRDDLEPIPAGLIKPYTEPQPADSDPSADE